MLINIKVPTIVCILIFVCKINAVTVLGSSNLKFHYVCYTYFIICLQLKFHAQMKHGHLKFHFKLPKARKTLEFYKILGVKMARYQVVIFRTAGLEVIKCFLCSAQLRLKFILLINVKMPTIVGMLTFISGINY